MLNFALFYAEIAWKMPDFVRQNFPKKIFCSFKKDGFRSKYEDLLFHQLCFQISAI